MTTDKARKRAIRTRMAKTGERYAAARRHVVDADPPAGPPTLPPRVAEPGMTDAAIARGTGRGWDDWFALLDAWGASGRPHRLIAGHIREEHEIDGWWAQAVAVGYERARGLRAVHETSRGFEVSVSKTLAADPGDVVAAFTQARRRNRWLEPGLLRARAGARASAAGHSARFDVPADGTSVGIRLEPRGAGRTTVTVTHGLLAGAADVTAHRAAWKARLERLSELFRDG